MGDPLKYAAAYNRLCRIAEDFCKTLWEMKDSSGTGECFWFCPQNIYSNGRIVGTVYLSANTSEIFRVHDKRAGRCAKKAIECFHSALKHAKEAR